DESDNASVNSGTDDDVKTINRLIRTLLNLFNQNTYIGYTATPYANIFIPSSWSNQLETVVKGHKLKVGEDLFPRDFIVNIPPPSNYIGPMQVFGYLNETTGEDYEGLDIIRSAEDQEPYFPKSINKKNKTELPDEIPQSLKEAIKSFILSCAIRRLRGQENKDNSMLVHVALYVNWIDRVAWLVNEVLRDYKNQIHSKQGPILNELKELFLTDYVNTTENVIRNLPYKDPKIKQCQWNEIEKVLDAAVTKIEVRSVHGTKNTRLLEYHQIEDLNYDNYPNGLSVIAVGGNRLARGITLEGLTISYFLRTSHLYDSLMQMGRWFGYRPGYVDLCRLYTTNELISWYKHVTLATEEMRADFDKMGSMNMRPVDYQLKVRTHPGLLSITSVTKMRGCEKIQIGFSGKKIQTYELLKDQDLVKHNYSAFSSFLLKLSDSKELTTKTGDLNGILWSNVNPENIISFIETYKSALPGIRTDIIGNYIRAQIKNDVNITWSVKLTLNSKSTNQFKFNSEDDVFIAGLPQRTNKSTNSKIYTLSKQNILDKVDRKADLTITEENPSEDLINNRRAEEKKALLVIYPLDPTEDPQLDNNIPLVSWALIFPEIKDEETVEYAARLTQGAEDSDEDDDIDGENEY
ncbi:MAG: Z1 domain-containing protein, partial [Tannerellaceae bacterium]